MKRAAVCIGVDRAGNLPPLRAAAAGAKEFAAWAEGQGCETKLLTDADDGDVSLRQITKAIAGFVSAGVYEQLIVYFAGHGILKQAETEYWLLSGAPEDPNEAVNLFGSIALGRNSRIPHLVFVSDACRSRADSSELLNVGGGVIFPNSKGGAPRPQVDVFYATLPGDPAYEVALKDSTAAYKGIFTESLLEVVRAPSAELVDSIDDGEHRRSIVYAWKLKDHLEALVPLKAEAVRITLRQIPELRIESHPPKYLAILPSVPAVAPTPRRTVRSGRRPAKDAPATADSRSIPLTASLRQDPIGDSLAALKSTHFWQEPGAATPRKTRTTRGGAQLHKLASSGPVDRTGLTTELEALTTKHGRGHFETTTGMTVHGAGVADASAAQWRTEVFRDDHDADATHVRLTPVAKGKSPARGRAANSLLLEFAAGIGTVVGILPGFIGTIVVEQNRIVSVNYVPSDQTPRYNEYLLFATELERMKAYAAVAARNGRFVVERERASDLADRLRRLKAFDPILGLYAAYAYAQHGQIDELTSVFAHMRDDTAPVPFDVAMLAARFGDAPAGVPKTRAGITPFCPMLSQGWALIFKGDALNAPLLQKLQPRLLPSLWTCFDARGVALVRAALKKGDVQ
ncbi:MAG: caspase family protein [Planctomycetota bacterium]